MYSMPMFSIETTSLSKGGKTSSRSTSKGSGKRSLFIASSSASSDEQGLQFLCAPGTAAFENPMGQRRPRKFRPEKIAPRFFPFGLERRGDPGAALVADHAAPRHRARPSRQDIPRRCARPPGDPLARNPAMKRTGRSRAAPPHRAGGSGGCGPACRYRPRPSRTRRAPPGPQAPPRQGPQNPCRPRARREAPIRGKGEKGFARPLQGLQVLIGPMDPGSVLPAGNQKGDPSETDRLQVPGDSDRIEVAGVSTAWQSILASALALLSISTPRSMAS